MKASTAFRRNVLPADANQHRTVFRRGDASDFALEGRVPFTLNDDPLTWFEGKMQQGAAEAFVFDATADFDDGFLFVASRDETKVSRAQPVVIFRHVSLLVRLRHRLRSDTVFYY